MPMTWNEQGERIVELGVLLEWYRKMLTNSPVHQYWLRRARREHETLETNGAALGG